MTFHVAVVGGGIAGLAAAHELTGALPDGSRVTLLEASDRLGGKIRTTEIGGRPVDEGADAFLARVPWATDLCRDIGLTDLVSPATGHAWLWSRGALRPLPAGLVLGLPTDVWSVLRSKVLSLRGVARAALDLVLPGRPVDTGDASVGEVVRRRLGREVDERLVEPLLGGIYAGRTRSMELATTAPQLADVAGGHRSLTLGLRAQRRAHPPDRAAPVFLAPRGGMAALTDRLARLLAESGRADVRLGWPVASVERAADGGFVLTRAVGPATAGPTPSADTVRADAVVVAAPAFAAARMLAASAPATAGLLRGIDYASVVLVTFTFDAGSVPAHPLPGSGVLVPVPEGRLVTAISWASSKWTHLARPDVVTLRVSAGRVDDTRVVRLTDDDVVAGMRADLRDLMGITDAPTAVRVSRWTDSFPQYRPGHGALVDRIDAALADELPGVVLAGAAYRGIGIPACVRQGREAATGVLATLTSAG